MIFYYSATGNTRYAAMQLACLLGEDATDLLSVSEEYTLPKSGRVGFMFPIYCWGVPPVVWNFLKGVCGRISSSVYAWMVCTCGDEAGVAMRNADRLLTHKRGRGADAIFSLIMPNTYVLLPGFDVDKPSVESEKLKHAPFRLKYIAERILKGESGVYDVTEGSLPTLRSSIFPIFRKWGVFPKYWKASASCISCGKCAHICPAHNIDMADGRPCWGKNCYSCCVCFHVCPTKAVSYGSITRGKSQYLFPYHNLSATEAIPSAEA